MVRQMYQMIPSRDIVDQRIIHSDWASTTHGHTQSKETVLGC